jgi:hypothetical protein
VSDDPAEEIALVIGTGIAVPLIGATAGVVPGIVYGVAVGYLAGTREDLGPALPPRVQDEVTKDMFRRRPIVPQVGLETEGWDAWLGEEWDNLVRGKEIPVPPELPTPPEVGFIPTRLAKDVGQTADWSLPLQDGSRLHAHEFESAFLVHRDRLDPGRGPLRALWHWLTETREGTALLGCACIAGMTAWIAQERFE